jgi:hypothetical protein
LKAREIESMGINIMSALVVYIYTTGENFGREEKTGCWGIIDELMLKVEGWVGERCL